MTRAPYRSQGKQELDRVIASRLYCEGRSISDIAENMGVPRHVVKFDLAKVRKEWLASSIINFDDARAEQLAKIDRMEEKAWRLLEKSELPIENKTAKVSQREGQAQKKKSAYRPADKMTTQIVQKEERVGDPRFLVIIQNCIEQRCKLLGLFAPMKSEGAGNSGSAGTNHVEHDFAPFNAALEKAYGSNVPPTNPAS